MNSFVERYSTTSLVSQLRRAQRLVADDDEEFSDATWGSEAGFGNLAKGLPTFTVPDVPDVSPRTSGFLLNSKNIISIFSLQLS